ncbi:MAG: sigma-70 family RNA polymerase sigma factor [Vicinamibacteria bacterium]
MSPDRRAEPPPITEILARWGEGHRDALDDLVPAVYSELRRLAKAKLAKERSGHTLQPTALVNEAFLRLGSYQRISFQDRAHFFAVAARIMRRILVDHARKRRAAKRGGPARQVTLSESRLPGKPMNVDLIALDEALARLEKKDRRQCEIVEMRYFGGLDDEEIAEVLGTSVPTVKRDWRVAKLWLRRALSVSANTGNRPLRTPS